MDEKGNIISDIEQYYTLNKDQRDFILSQIEQRQYYKGQLLLEEGKICENFFLLPKVV